MLAVASASVLTCAVLGYVAAVLSGVKVAIGTVRVVVVGVLTLAATYGEREIRALNLLFHRGHERAMPGAGYGFSKVPGME